MYSANLEIFVSRFFIASIESKDGVKKRITVDLRKADYIANRMSSTADIFAWTAEHDRYKTRRSEAGEQAELTSENWKEIYVFCIPLGSRYRKQFTSLLYFGNMLFRSEITVRAYAFLKKINLEIFQRSRNSSIHV